MNDADRIRQLISQKPGLKARQIAGELELDPSLVAAALRELGEAVVQDNAYCWWPAAREPAAAGASPAPRTLLARLCRYFLECLSRESGAGASLPADQAGSGYVELEALPFAPRTPAPRPGDRAVKRIVQKARRERGQLALYVGYAVRVRTARLGNEEETRLEPLLLYPIEDPAEGKGDALRPACGIPLFNLEVLKSLPSADSGNLIDEAIQLSEELGLANAEDDLPQWDEIMPRLERCRPDWDWRETLDPHRLSQGAPLAGLPPGIYNRAVLFAGTRSPFTYGLENELRKLEQLDEEAVAGTALGAWLRGGSIEAPEPEDRPILELLPLNTEQRQAVLRGLSAPLTVVTGPPGTGKSQVVISLLANSAWQRQSVLFASKNNHAVDVVEERANALGPQPLLLRLGKEEHHVRLARELTASLAQSSGSDDAAGYAWLARVHQETGARFAAVQREIAEVVELRNRADELERAAEPARAALGRERFAEARAFDVEGARLRVESLAAALAAAGASQAAVARLLGDPSRSRRVKGAAEAARLAAGDAESLGVAPPSGGPDEGSLDAWAGLHRDLAARLEMAAAARAYWDALERLRQAPPIERLARELTRIAEESARGSLDLWQAWLRLWPSRWNPDDRKTLAEYVSLLQIIAGGDRYDEGAGRKVFRRYYSLFPKVTQILPCWAVTSLSARGRLPFEPGFFDAVVIDEASQCDIASALPLLYRARRAVVIGDPLQLKHVSAVAPQQDRMMLAAHGLAEGHAAWAYSVNSLFDLARALCRYEDLVNLRDHHRSHRDIISFSNLHYYRGALRVATDHDALNRPDPPGPAVRWVDVKGKVVRPPKGGAVNAREAEAVAAEVRKLVFERGYQGAIGVVTPFRAHANRIRTLVHQDRELAARLAELDFVVDTVHGFQGDERDVIFLSPVVSAGVAESTLRFLKSNANLFNVAITRARSELAVVGDRQAALDSGVGYLAGFAAYVRDLESREAPGMLPRQPGPDYPPVARPELVSDWERIFYKALFEAGLDPVPQYEEAPFTLDFALFDGERKLDIEVDGEHYHRHWDGELCRRDQIRSRRLNDLGWDVMRFWVYEVRDDLAGAVARVKSWLSRQA